MDDMKETGDRQRCMELAHAENCIGAIRNLFGSEAPVSGKWHVFAAHEAVRELNPLRWEARYVPMVAATWGWRWIGPESSCTIRPARRRERRHRDDAEPGFTWRTNSRQRTTSKGT